MRRRGFSPADIRKIAGGNYLRVFNQSAKPA
jgi:microsomal dipeptidase-like Zn-dependent dipeptidase